MTDTAPTADESRTPADEPWSPVEESREPRYLLPITGAVGLIAASILTIDKITLLESKVDGTDAALNCDLSAFVSCSGVMESDQASAFGFANSIIGVIGFAVVLTLGVLVLARVALPRFVWAGLQLGTIFGIGFVTWLQVQSIYEINKLCPWCMVVWIMMIPLFVGVTARNLRSSAPASGVTRFVTNWTPLIVALWYLAVAAAIWFQFGSEQLFA
ncbi:MAG: vitamin K epoxide reductase family protein [Aeromicrobium sp.]|uniref:vitamin K epoxide reductase family protein n=1 Tax=Aeromicrobium sp. TaxID=1871063 RepID=UPI003C556543